MQENILFTKLVPLEKKGGRLDKFITAEFPQFSRAQAQRLIVSGNVSVDDFAVTDNAFKIRVDDVYQVIVPDAEEADPEPENIPLDVVFEDNDLIVINKAAGMTVHPGAGAYSGTLVNALLYHCRDNLSGIGGVKRPGIVHRIDKDTSGLLVAAKNDLAHRGLSEQFFEHSVERVYQAFCFGLPNPLVGRIEISIGRSPVNRKKMAVVTRGGKQAITHYNVLRNLYNVAAMVECRLETGRTHQIRVHLTHIGHGLIGDQLYSVGKKIKDKNVSEEFRELVNNFPRQALHAKTLGFIHPRTGERLSFDSELPEDMRLLQQD